MSGTLRLFEGSGPRLFFVPPGADFAEALARGLRARLTDQPPEAMARVELWVNTHRAGRAVEAALAAAAQATFLPRMRALGEIGLDAHDAPLTVEPMRRLLTLTKLVTAFLTRRPEHGPLAAAPALARALASLLDECGKEGVGLDALAGAAPPEHAEHWGRLLDFLAIVAETWPAIREAADPESARRAAVEAALARWEGAPPQGPVIAAGSTGSVGTTAAILAAVARAPQGAVVLPGFDSEIAALGWEAIGETHPYAGFRRLFDALGLSPADAAPWVEAEDGRAPRRRLLGQALRPAPATDAWLAARAAIAADAGAATAGLTLVEAADPRREAAAAALAIREALETEGRRVALVTTDRTLARRVAAALARWDIEPDDSAGRPLALTPPGVVLRLLADIAARGADPVALLAALKHPLAGAGAPRGDWLSAVRRLELHALRRRPDLAEPAAIRDAWRAIEAARAAAGAGPDDDEDDDGPLVEIDDAPDPAAASVAQGDRRPGDAPPGAASETGAPSPAASSQGARAEGAPAAAEALDAALGRIAALAEALRRPGATLAEQARAHRETAEALAAPALWDKAAGEAARAAFDRFEAAAAEYGPSPAAAYPSLLAEALSGEAREEAYRPDPRVSFQGPLESRAQSADLVILAGLVEGSWPVAPAEDPWLSRPMRQRLGLPPPERAAGLAAHDFLGAACAPEVLLTRARKAGGAPTRPSRFLARLTTLLEGAAPEALRAMRERGARLAAMVDPLERPEDETPRAERPKPRPPVEARPRKLSATAIETLIRDPYAIYARHVLRLRALDPVGRVHDARDRGVWLHRVMERALAATIPWPPDPEAVFARAVEEALAEAPAPAALRRLWAARLARIAPIFLAEEAARRGAGEPLGCETTGERRMTAPDFLLAARADRIDRLTGGDLAIYDYKTGAPPSPRQMKAFAKQLPLEGAIAAAGGFEGVKAAQAGALAHISLGSGAAGGRARGLDDPAEAAAAAWEGLARLIAAYDDPATGYLARARPEHLSHEGDYDHLARFGEWGDEEGGL